jgi:hypothetical protein
VATPEAPHRSSSQLGCLGIPPTVQTNSDSDEIPHVLPASKTRGASSSPQTHRQALHFNRVPCVLRPTTNHDHCKQASKQANKRVSTKYSTTSAVLLRIHQIRSAPTSRFPRNQERPFNRRPTGPCKHQARRKQNNDPTEDCQSPTPTSTPTISAFQF